MSIIKGWLVSTTISLGFTNMVQGHGPRAAINHSVPWLGLEMLLLQSWPYPQWLVRPSATADLGITHCRGCPGAQSSELQQEQECTSWSVSWCERIVVLMEVKSWWPHSSGQSKVPHCAASWQEGGRLPARGECLSSCGSACRPLQSGHLWCLHTAGKKKACRIAQGHKANARATRSVIVVSVARHHLQIDEIIPILSLGINKWESSRVAFHKSCV